MEFNAVQQQYRPSSNRSYTATQPSSRHAAQLMYSYGNLALQSHQPHALQQQQQQQHHQSPVQPQHSRASPPFPSWALQQAHNPYSHLSKGPMQQLKDTSPTGHSDNKIDVSGAQQSSMHAQSYPSYTGQEPSMTPDFFAGTVIDTSPWGQKVCEDLDAFPSLDPDMSEFNQALMANDEDTPIIDLRQYPSIEHEGDHMGSFNPSSSRRLSESSFSMSSTGGALQDVSTYEDLGSTEAVAYASDCDTWGNNLEPAPSLLSPLASPRRTQHESVVRSGSRSRASPAPHNNVRSSPYTMESSRFKRWSTGHAPTSTPSSSRALASVQDRYPYGQTLNPHHSLPAYTTSPLSNFQLHSNVLYSQPHPLQSSDPNMFASPPQPFHLEVPRPLPSQGLFRLLQSNADRHGGCSSHFADLSDPPDLYSSLSEQPSDPPESDMNPSDPDLVPHEQDLRFVGDLYTPRWVRGHGNKREGWCGLCKPGRWLVLKNSAFWYDKSFTHGVSAATGAAFQGPQDTRRTEGNPDVWEGLCGSCGDWIALVSSKKKGTTWFRHAYKCHTHPKVKDGPKRRRETHTVRARAASSASATSSSYPISKEPSQDSFQTPTTSNAQQHSHLPTISSGPTSHAMTPNATLSSTSSMQPPPPHQMHTLIEPKQEPQEYHEPVVGMFSHPLHPMSTFSNQGQAQSLGLASVRVSEPELVGVKSSVGPMNNLADMI